VNLYLISRNRERDQFESYHSVVVIAESEDEALKIRNFIYELERCDPKDLIVKLIGISISNVPGVVCASYHEC